MDDEDDEWAPRHSTLIRVIAIVVSVSLVVAGLGTVLEMILTTH
jgi:hypothetical protein